MFNAARSSERLFQRHRHLYVCVKKSKTKQAKQSNNFFKTELWTLEMKYNRNALIKMLESGINKKKIFKRLTV